LIWGKYGQVEIKQFPTGGKNEPTSPFQFKKIAVKEPQRTIMLLSNDLQLIGDLAGQ